MISLDQVLLLQKKVETAVEKINFLTGQIEQLKNDNDALRTKCAELTKALDEKTELVSSLEANQGKIEEGILTALNRLDTVENAILGGGIQAAAAESAAGESAAADQQSSDEEVEDDDTAAFDYSGSSTSSEESPELKEVTEEIADTTNSSTDVQMNDGAASSQNEGQSQDGAMDNGQEAAPQDQDSSAQGQDADSLNGQFDIF
ncbi:MAG: hypothetical protein K6G18_03585 [Treponema sp.]|nr:hypothetical protein [Treponema sp.]